MKRKFLITILALMLACFGLQSGAFATTTTTAKTAPVASAQTVYVNAQALDIVKNPAKYLNKHVRIKATFDKFTNLGLDYKPAMRSSQDYITFLILRDDAGENIIPLSEMKLFLKRKVAEKHIDLETGDKIQIEGKVFSNALSDAWIDVTRIVVISKKHPKKV